VLPKRSVTVKDSAAYGVILTQGYGRSASCRVVDAVLDPVLGR